MTKNQDMSLPPVIRRGRYDTLTIFEVSESELDSLERGAPDSTLFSVSIFSLSSALSFTIAMATTTMTAERHSVFLAVTSVGYVLGIVLLFIWLKTRQTTSSLIKTIKKRLPPDGVQEPVEVSVADA